MISIGEKIREVRIARNLTQKRLDQRRRYGIKSLIKKSKNLIDKRKKSVIIKHVLKIPKQLYLHNTQLEGG